MFACLVGVLFRVFNWYNCLIGHLRLYIWVVYGIIVYWVLLWYHLILLEYCLLLRNIIRLLYNGS